MTEIESTQHMSKLSLLEGPLRFALAMKDQAVSSFFLLQYGSVPSVPHLLDWGVIVA